ncbi:uncharacterized protein METZ01_LOCUS480183 [marine metagenome]|uniref:Uncharacterized protein n=1 Tax=marine metagenome TaxID=408172 RepID=A0A383C5J2_9ZZZZ
MRKSNELSQNLTIRSGTFILIARVTGMHAHYYATVADFGRDLRVQWRVAWRNLLEG